MSATFLAIYKYSPSSSLYFWLLPLPPSSLGRSGSPPPLLSLYPSPFLSLSLSSSACPLVNSRSTPISPLRSSVDCSRFSRIPDLKSFSDLGESSKMMRARTTARALSPVKEKSFVSGGSPATNRAGISPEDVKWEVMPCGMLVQKRNPDSETLAPAPTIRVRVKYASASHEIYLSAQSTFGELKKILAEKTGLHPQDQKLIYKDRERDSTAFLDISGVKDRSKILLEEDAAGKARRVLEMRKNAKMEKAAKSLSQICSDVEKLATKVSALESIAAKGKKVAESDVVGLIEQLMNQLLKLDGLAVEGDAKLQRGTQVRRVQKFVETLDALKIKNSEMQQKRSTTNWESIDLLSGPPPSLAAPPKTPPKAASSGGAAAIPAARLDWELF